jgi:hypothetical protein
MELAYYCHHTAPAMACLSLIGAHHHLERLGYAGEFKLTDDGRTDEFQYAVIVSQFAQEGAGAARKWGVFLCANGKPRDDASSLAAVLVSFQTGFDTVESALAKAAELAVWLHERTLPVEAWQEIYQTCDSMEVGVFMPPQAVSAAMHESHTHTHH